MMARRRNDPDYVPAGLNASLLMMRAWCQIHRRSHAANHMVGTRIEAKECPHCVKDKDWLRKAYRELAGQPDQADMAKVIALAEQHAGHPLMRYATYGK
jgi:glutaredoxin